MVGSDDRLAEADRLNSHSLLIHLLRLETDLFRLGVALESGEFSLLLSFTFNLVFQENIWRHDQTTAGHLGYLIEGIFLLKLVSFGLEVFQDLTHFVLSLNGRDS